MTSRRILRSRGQGRFVLLRDHASNHIPAELRHLGPSKSNLRRHIARDIGSGKRHTPLRLAQDSRKTRSERWYEPYHAMRRGLAHLQLEFRLDEIATAAAQRRWALTFAGVLNACL